METVTGYACLASAIINGDESGLDEEGLLELKRFLDYCDGFEILSVGDSYYGHPDDGSLPGEVADYTVRPV